MTLAALAAGSAIAAEPGAQFLRSRDVVLELRSQAAAEAVAYVSRDNTTTWFETAVARLGETTYCFSAPDDGTYEFYFVLRNDAGPSAEPPVCGAPAHLSVVIDTTPPIVQFRELTIGGDADNPTAYGRIALIENDVASLRLFYRTSAKRTWTDAGSPALVAGRFGHPLPRATGQTIDLCIVATDRAGNAARDERVGLWMPEPTAPVAVQAADIAFANSGEADDANELSAEQRAAAPPLLGDAEPTELRTRNGRTGASASTDDASDAIEKLRSAAAEFAMQGRWSLSAARLQDALRLAPNDPGLLSGLGKSEYELGQYEAAAQHYGAILNNAPDHVGALEGLALVEATQRRYPAARDTLLRLLERQPAAAHNWLNYGDVEYRLGNVAKAQSAWEKAAAQADADQGVRAGVQRRMKMIVSPPTRPAGEAPAGVRPAAGARNPGTQPPRK